MYEHSDSIKQLAAALAKVQAALQPAIKDKNNPAFKGAKYADLNAVWDVCRQPLTENGLSVAQMPVGNDSGRIGLTTMLMHESGEWLANTVYVRLAKDDPQGAGSGLTYLRRYSLAAMVGIVADEDDDGNAASQQSQRQAQPHPPQKPTLDKMREAAKNIARQLHKDKRITLDEGKVYASKIDDVVDYETLSDIIKELNAKAA